MRRAARLLAMLPALTAAGCFPYHETYRPALTGVVLDSAQHPVPGAQVVACTVDNWAGWPDGACPRRGATTTGPDGRFQLPAVREVEWCCLGEAPLPLTRVAACARDAAGRPLVTPTADFPAPPPPGDLRLEVAAPQHPVPPDCLPGPAR